MHAIQPRADLAHADRQHALIQLQLRLAGPTLDGAADPAARDTSARASDPGLPIEVRPAANQPRLRMGELGKFHLQFAFVGPGPVREDVEDEFRTGHDAALEGLLQVALLRRRQVVVEHDDGGRRAADRGFESAKLAYADEPTRVRRLPCRGDRLRNHEARGAHQFLELVAVSVAMVVIGAGETHRYEQRPVARGRAFEQQSLLAGQRLVPFRLRLRRIPRDAVDSRRYSSSSASTIGIRTARDGTTVEMACL